MPEFAKPVVVVSQCLGFARCRWDESSAASDSVTRLRDYVEFKPVCPEVAIGLGVPRAPIKVIAGAGGHTLYQPETGLDLTEPMTEFCQTHPEASDSIDGFILKARSPSCGTRDVKIYAENGRKTLSSTGSGFWGGAVLSRYTGFPIEDEIRLENPRIREHFYTGIFTRARFRQVLSKGNMRELVRFHTDQKLLLMAYNQAALKRLSHIVANPEKMKTTDVLTQYAKHLYAALAHPPRQSSAVLTLMHIQEEFSAKLATTDKALFLETLSKYRTGTAPLSVCLHQVQGWFKRFKHPNLQRQSFFCPYPVELVGDIVE